MDYLGHTFPLCYSLHTWLYLLDLEDRQAIVLDDGNRPILLQQRKILLKL
jgi:hypothetical protein